VTPRNWGLLLLAVGFVLLLVFALWIPGALVAGGASAVLLMAIGGLMISGRLPTGK